MVLRRDLITHAVSEVLCIMLSWIVIYIVLRSRLVTWVGQTHTLVE